MTGTRNRRCGDKHPWPSKGAALDHARFRRTRGAPGWTVNVYRCPDCRAWHVGHRPRRRHNP